MAQGKQGLTPKEKGRLRQLAAALLLFGVVFFGRGTDWGPAAQAAGRLGAWVRADTDLQEVFAQVGTSFSQGEPAVETFKALFTGVEETEPEGETQETQEEIP
jgi:hypothetical protein